MKLTLYKSLLEQTIWDVALQHYGDVEGVAFLLADNIGCIDANGIIANGQIYKIRTGTAVDERVILAYEGYVPVTDGGADALAVLIDENGDYLIDDGGDTLVSPS